MYHVTALDQPARARVDVCYSRRSWLVVACLLMTCILMASPFHSTEASTEAMTQSNPDSMPVVTFAVPLAADKVVAARELLAELKRTHLAGLAERARAVGYHKEVMVLQTGSTGNFLVIHMETDDASAQSEFRKRLRAYPETQFTRWWNPAFDTLGQRPALADELFTWEDSERANEARGERQVSLGILKLSNERAQGLRELVGELKAAHFAGLVERARSVGYYKESMHLQPTADGQLLIVYLEHVGGDLRKRIREYPDTDFTRWWNPQFRGLVDGGAIRREGDQAELLLDWER